MKAAGETPYPHKFHVEMSLSAYIDKYSHLEDGVRLEDTLVTLAGKRKSAPFIITHRLGPWVKPSMYNMYTSMGYTYWLTRALKDV